METLLPLSPPSPIHLHNMFYITSRDAASLELGCLEKIRAAPHALCSKRLLEASAIWQVEEAETYLSRDDGRFFGRRVLPSRQTSIDAWKIAARSSKEWRNGPSQQEIKRFSRRLSAEEGGPHRREGGRQRSCISERDESEGVAQRSGQNMAARVQLPAHVDYISSVGNAFVKHVVKLRQSSSYRHACGSFVIVGDVPLREMCDFASMKGGREALIDCLFVLDNSKVPAGIVESSKRVVRVTSVVMHKLCGMDSTEGVEAVGVTPLPASFCALDQTGNPVTDLVNWCPSPRRLLVLDTIQDPGNLGTLIRTAAAFDWDGVFLLHGCCDPFNEKALRASRGACFRIPIASGVWSQLQEFADVKHIKLYAGEPERNKSALSEEAMEQSIVHSIRQELHSGKNERDKRNGLSMSVKGPAFQSLANIAGEDSLCLVLGSEGQGLSKEALEACSLISIPMPGRFESLNVAVAGGILLFALKKIHPKTKRESEFLEFS